MSYKIVYARSAYKDIQKLDTVIKKRIKRKIEEDMKDPIKSAKKLISSNLGTYRLRIGNYRIIFDIDKNNIIILRVGHRKEIYK